MKKKNRNADGQSDGVCVSVCGKMMHRRELVIGAIFSALAPGNAITQMHSVLHTDIHDDHTILCCAIQWTYCVRASHTVHCHCLLMRPFNPFSEAHQRICVPHIYSYSYERTDDPEEPPCVLFSAIADKQNKNIGIHFCRSGQTNQ